jgi:hypothetical protein
MRTISVGPPAWAMAWPVLFVAGLIIPVLLSGPGNDNFGAAIPVLLAAACVYRVAWLSLRGSADGLVVRNCFYTRRVPISEVVGFDVGHCTGRGFGFRTVRVVTPERAIPIDAYALRMPWIRARSRAGLNQAADNLTAWAEEARENLAQTAAEPAGQTDPG